MQRYNLQYHGCGSRAKHEIEQVINKIVKYATKTGKDIAIEDLNFKKTKAKQLTSNNPNTKNYNNMLHKFDYSRYKTTLDNCCHRRKVNLIMVNLYT